MSGKQHKAQRAAARARAKAASVMMTDLPMQQLAAIVDRTRTGPLNAEDHAILKVAVDSFVFVTEELKNKNTSFQRLRQMLFGSPTEKTSAVLGEKKGAEAASGSAGQASEQTALERTEPAPRKGHGRYAAAALTGAERVKVPHRELAAGEACLDPHCRGKVYPLAEPKKLVRITGVAPLSATVYECDRLRCNDCGDVFSAAAPEGVGDEKYDEAATAMVGMLRFGVGLPHNRIEKLQAGMGIPLPTSTQWDLVAEGTDEVEPAFEEMIRQGAQGGLFHNDDTSMKILKLTREQRAAALGEDADEARTGVFTSGIVSVREGVRIALFFTGARHAGENLEQMLKRRARDLPVPIQMCDASACNTAGDFETLLANCTVHGRRKFVEIAENFPAEVRFVLETLREVFKVERQAREDKLTGEERLALHQERSGPWMTGLKNWMRKQLKDGLVEENSGLGKAILYMRDHWGPLTLFLRVAGAPLENNLCERVLKKAILHRRGSLYYRTVNGARVGDLWMSLIHTCELNAVNPFEYLVALLQHPGALRENPSEWMPWTFRAALDRATAVPDTPRAAAA